MATYQQQYDPLYTQILTKTNECNYGHYQATVIQQVYIFMKQYTTFTLSTTQMAYSNGTTATCLCLTGTVGMTYQGKQYSIPLHILLPIGFPYTEPKVYLAYKLDEASAKNNPLIVNGNEVRTNYTASSVSLSYFYPKVYFDFSP